MNIKRHSSWDKWVIHRKLDFSIKNSLLHVNNIVNVVQSGIREKPILGEFIVNVKNGLGSKDNLHLEVNEIAINIKNTFQFNEEQIIAGEKIVMFLKKSINNMKLSRKLINLHILYLCFIYNIIPNSIYEIVPCFDITYPHTPTMVKQIGESRFRRDNILRKRHSVEFKRNS